MITVGLETANSTGTILIDYSKTKECNLYCENMIDYSILENTIFIGKIWLITVGLSILSPRYLRLELSDSSCILFSNEFSLKKKTV